MFKKYLGEAKNHRKLGENHSTPWKSSMPQKSDDEEKGFQVCRTRGKRVKGGKRKYKIGWEKKLWGSLPYDLERILAQGSWTLPKPKT